MSIPKNLRTLKTNFEEADGLGIISVQGCGASRKILYTMKVYINEPIFLGSSYLWPPAVSKNQSF